MAKRSEAAQPAYEVQPADASGNGRAADIAKFCCLIPIK
jgi:hypothetical protein